LDDGVWIAAALLHREQPTRVDFASREIERRFVEEGFPEGRSSYAMTISFDAVANKKPDPGKSRMLYETGRGRRRLFRHGDDAHPLRAGGADDYATRVRPRSQDLPERYRYLIDWYDSTWSGSAAPGRRTAQAPVSQGDDPIRAMVGLGQGLWSEEHPDDYVRRLRENWGE
jgi:hypothetical protein